MKMFLWLGHISMIGACIACTWLSHVAPPASAMEFQESTGDPTQDRPQNAESSVTSDEAGSLPPLPGVVARPADGTDHFDLVRAWDRYESTISAVVQALENDIDSQLDAAVRDGDLEGAEKWIAIKEKLRQKGELPSEKDLKGAAGKAKSSVGRAAADLVKAYDTLTKSLTQERRLEEARAVREERDAVLQQQDAKPAGGNTRRSVRTPAELKTYLENTTWGSDADPIVLSADGVLRARSWDERGLLTQWEVIDQRTVLLSITKGREHDRLAVITLNESLDEFRGTGFHGLEKWTWKRVRK